MIFESQIRIRPLVLIAAVGLALSCRNGGSPLAAARVSLGEYRRELEALRAGRTVHPLPDARFFLFGMGGRPKLLYRGGELVDAANGLVLKKWAVAEDVILPHAYAVVIRDSSGRTTEIREDSLGILLGEDGRSGRIPGTESRVRLPEFQGLRWARTLRVLHHEILVNIVNGAPVPNFFVYPEPWYRDGAMTAMCLARTGNLGLLRNWILGLSDPFDRNNAGEAEADNPGQALYLISLVSDRNHPLVPRLLASLRIFEKRRGNALYVCGRSDFAAHPVYQTKWAKLGLASLGLPDPYTVPELEDAYGALFWMRREGGLNSPLGSGDGAFYAYLDWASGHFFRTGSGPVGDRDYPLSWETGASQALYAGMDLVDPAYSKARTAAPHTWHAAEMFLALLEDQGTG